MKHNFDRHVSMAGLRHASVTGVYASFSKTAPAECVVVAVRYIDDVRNRSKQYVEYDVRDLKTGQIYPNCPVLMNGGGFEDGSEVILRAATKPLGNIGGSFTFDPRVDPVLESDGDRVMVSFVNAAHYSAVIVGVLPHVRSGYGAKRADGQRRYIAHHGVTFEMTQDGVFRLATEEGAKVHLEEDVTKIDGKASSGVLLGFNATEKAVKGDTAVAASTGPAASAAGALAVSMAAALVQLNLGNIPGALGTLISGLSSYAGAEQAAWSAFQSALSNKVRVE